MKKKVEEIQDSQGEEFVQEFDFYLDLPEGTERWFPEKGENEKDVKGRHFFDIVPFWVGPKYPTGKKGSKRGRNIDTNCDKDDL